MSPLRQKPGPSGAHAPLGQLLAGYVRGVIGHLPAGEETELGALAAGLREALGTRAEDWRGVVTEALQLSDTLDVAILDLWYTHRDALAADGERPDPAAFARRFVAAYLAQGSCIDVWTPQQLEAARARIARAGRAPGG